MTVLLQVYPHLGGSQAELTYFVTVTGTLDMAQSERITQEEFFKRLSLDEDAYSYPGGDGGSYKRLTFSGIPTGEGSRRTTLPVDGLQVATTSEVEGTFELGLLTGALQALAHVAELPFLRRSLAEVFEARIGRQLRYQALAARNSILSEAIPEAKPETYWELAESKPLLSPAEYGELLLESMRAALSVLSDDRPAMATVAAAYNIYFYARSEEEARWRAAHPDQVFDKFDLEEMDRDALRPALAFAATVLFIRQHSGTSARKDHGMADQNLDALELLTRIFAALDGEDTSIAYSYGITSSGKELSHNGLMAFVAEWDTYPEPPALGIAWEEMTPQQRWERARWSAQHALVQKLSELRKEFQALKTEDVEEKARTAVSDELVKQVLRAWWRGYEEGVRNAPSNRRSEGVSQQDGAKAAQWAMKEALQFAGGQPNEATVLAAVKTHKQAQLKYQRELLPKNVNSSNIYQRIAEEAMRDVLLEYT
jgi:hypothetical protein